MKTFFAIYKHEIVKVGGLIVYSHNLIELVEKSFSSEADAERRIAELPSGEYIVMKYFEV